MASKLTTLDSKNRRNPGVAIAINMETAEVVVKWSNATSAIRNAMLVMALELAKAQLLALPTSYTPTEFPGAS